MKKYILLVVIVFISCSSHAQKKDNNRYYQATYYGQDSLNSIQYGTFFFVLGNNAFPTKEQAKTLIIVSYKLDFSPTDNKLVVSLTEFKNKKEFYMWNRK